MAAVRRVWEPRTASERAVRLALVPASLAYGVAITIRNRLYDTGWLEQVRVDARVLSVGNLTVGGTGKTPAAPARAQPASCRCHRR